MAATSEPLLAKKHLELMEATDARIQSLEALVAQKEAELEHEKGNVKALTEDFEYNLSLIKERDEELERFEEAMETMKTAVTERDQEIAHLRGQLESAQQKLKFEQQKARELEQSQQSRIGELKSHRDAQLQEYEQLLRKRDEEMTEMQHSFAQQIKEQNERAEERLRSQLAAAQEQHKDREAALWQRERELKDEVDSLKHAVSEKGIAVAQLTEQLKAAESQRVAEAKKVKEEQTKLARLAAEFEEKTREMQRDSVNTKKAFDARLAAASEAQEKLQSTVEKLERERNALSAEISTARESGDTACARLRKDVEMKEAELIELRQTISDLQQELRVEQTKLSNATAKLQAELAAKDRAVESKVTELTSKAAELAGQQETVHSLRLQLQAATLELKQKDETVSTLKAELQHRREECDNLSNEVTKATERAFQLEAKLSVTQLEHDNVVEELSTKIENLQLELSEAKQAPHTNASEAVEKLKGQLRASEQLRRTETAEWEKSLREKDERIDSLRRRLNASAIEASTIYPATSKLGSRPRPSEAPELPSAIGNATATASSHWQPTLAFPTIPPDVSSGSDYGPVSPPMAPSHQHGGSEKLVAELRIEVEDLREKNASLAEQNDRIMKQVRSLAKDMAADPIMQKTRDLESTVEELKNQLHAKKKEIVALEAELMDSRKELEEQKDRAGGVAGDAIVRLTEEMRAVKAELHAERRATEMYRLLHDHPVVGYSADLDHPKPASTSPHIAGLESELVKTRKKYEKAKAVCRRLSDENGELRAKLKQAGEDLQRLVAEKGKLLSINNMMRGDLQLLASSSHNPPSRRAYPSSLLAAYREQG